MNDSIYLKKSVRAFPRTMLRGVGQVMFQDNMWTGLLFSASPCRRNTDSRLM